MTRIRLALVIVLSLLIGAHASAQYLPSNGILYASDFGQWNLPQGTSPTNGSIAWPSTNICRPASQGYTLNPLQVGRKIRIVDQRPNMSETVAITSVSKNVCSISTATMAATHTTYTVVSGTAGLQEAIDSAVTSNAGAVVVLTPGWTALGGTTAMITAAAGSAQVSILDQRLAKPVAYKWDVPTSAYVIDPFGGGSGSVNPSPQYRVTYYNTPGTQSSVLGDTGSTTDGAGNMTVASLIGRFVSSLPQAKQWRTNSGTTDGCQLAFNAGNPTCYVEQNTADAGAITTLASPLFHASDDRYPGHADTYTNGIAGFNGASVLAPRRLYYFDNKTPDPTHPLYTYTTRPLGDQEDCNFLNKGRNDAAGTTVSQWTSGQCHLHNVNNWGAGIRQYDSGRMFCYGVGDCMMSYWYQYFYGGIQDGSGEGVRGMALQVLEGGGNATGTVASTYTGTGITKVKLNGSYATAGVGHYFVDRQTVKASGTIISTTNFNFIGTATTTGTFTPSAWMGTATLPVTNSPVNLDNPPVNSFTFTTSLGDSAQLAVNKHVCLASANSSEGEELIIQSVSVSGSSVTLGLANKRIVGAYTNVALGSCDAVDLVSTRLKAANGAMNPIMVIGYPSTNQMMIAYWAKGGFQADYGMYINPGTSCNITISQSGTKVTATLGATGTPNASYCSSLYYVRNPNTTISGTTDFNGTVTPSYVDSSTTLKTMTWTSGTSATIGPETGTVTLANVNGNFTIYPMAIVANLCDDNTTNPVSVNNETYKQACLDGTVDLENNSINIAAGDTWEVPHYNAIRGNALFLNFQQDTFPFQTVPYSLNTGGEGIGGSIMDITNQTPSSYVGSGGRIAVPPVVIPYRGANAGFVRTYAPSYPGSAVVDVLCSTSSVSYTSTDCTNTPHYYLWRVVSSGGKYAAAHYFPSSGDMTYEISGGGVLGFNNPFQAFVGNSSTAITKAGQFFYNSTTQRMRGSDTSLALHDIPWRDEVCLSSGTGCGAVPPSGAAGGDLSGTYPNPTVSKVNGGSVPQSAPVLGTNSIGQVVNNPNPVVNSINATSGTIGGLFLGGATEAGSVISPSTPYYDFHSSGNNNDYDSRIIATGGTSSTNQGTLNFSGAHIQANNSDICTANGANCPAGSSVLLQTNGSNNGSQSTLNLVGGSGISVSNSGGTTTITNTGGGGGSYSLGGAPGSGNVSFSAGAGSGASLVSIQGLDGSFYILFTAGSGSSTSNNVFTVNFTSTRGHLAFCTSQLILNGDSADHTIVANGLGFFSATSVTMYLPSTSTPLVAGNSYGYIVSCP